MKAQQMTSPRSGVQVANQFILNDGLHSYFQSYQSIIAKKCLKTGVVVLDEKKWNYSVTTSKYLNQFLQYETPAKEGVKNGLYALVNLN